MADLACSICLFVRSGEAEAAITVINGQAVCEDHMAYVQGNPHASALTAATRKIALRDGEWTGFAGTGL